MRRLIARVARWWAPGFAVALIGCSGFSESPEACFAPKLAPIEAAFVNEAVSKCQGYGWEACPDRQALEAKYDDLREQAKESCQ